MKRRPLCCFVALGLVASTACLAPQVDETAADGLGLRAPEEGGGRPRTTACTPAKRFVAKAWTEADALFHRDPRWLGGDAAYSILLSPGRVLWLFGDSFVATTPRHVRRESKMVRNSIAIQSGTDPTTSTIAFGWRGDAQPSSFFPEEGDHWLWPVHGARIGDEVVLFLNELEKIDGGLGFASVGTRMLRIKNPDDEPEKWTWSSRTLPEDGRSHGTSVVTEGGFLYSLTTRPSFFFDVEVERWPVGALDAPSRFWTGKGYGASKQSAPIWKVGAPEFVTAPHCSEWLTVESTGFGATDIAIRRAPALTGPWSEPVKIFHPEESDRPKPFVYAGKLHPELTGADLVVTYAANSFDFDEVLRDESLYYPRFVRIAETR